MITWRERDQHQSLSARARDLLAQLHRGPLSYSCGRNFPGEWRELLYQGLAFHAHDLITITPKGEDIAERCT